MSEGFLLDTNLISDTAPDRRTFLSPEKAAARAWINAHQARLFLPVTAVAEIAGGIGSQEAAGATRHARDLASWLAFVMAAYQDRILPYDVEAALLARPLHHAARLRGLSPDFADLTVACIARAHGLVVATRNIRDFAPMGIETVDPFQT